MVKRNTKGTSLFQAAAAVKEERSSQTSFVAVQGVVGTIDVKTQAPKIWPTPSLPLFKLDLTWRKKTRKKTRKLNWSCLTVVHWTKLNRLSENTRDDNINCMVTANVYFLQHNRVNVWIKCTFLWLWMKMQCHAKFLLQPPDKQKFHLTQTWSDKSAVTVHHCVIIPTTIWQDKAKLQHTAA